MDAVTAVSGSGPAYFALLAEAMIEAGILLGLSREVSTQLVVQTMLGTAKQLRDLKMHPVELREMVTSPGRDDDRRDPRARAGRRARRVPERDPGRDGPLARARQWRFVTSTASASTSSRIPARLAAGWLIHTASRARPRRALRRVAAGRAYELAAELQPDWRRTSTSGSATSVPCRPTTSARTTASCSETLLDRLVAPPTVHRIHGELGAAGGRRALRRASSTASRSTSR